jgi:hypothetical protein
MTVTEAQSTPVPETVILTRRLRKCIAEGAHHAGNCERCGQ